LLVRRLTDADMNMSNRLLRELKKHVAVFLNVFMLLKAIVVLTVL